MALNNLLKSGAMKKVASRQGNTHPPSADDAVDILLSSGTTDGGIDKFIDTITRQHDTITQQHQIIEKKSGVIDEQKKRIALLEEYLRLERARRFGPSSEKSVDQGELFNEPEALSDVEETLSDQQELPVAEKKRGRKGLSKNLPRHQVHLDLSDDEKADAIDTFYTVVKEELDIVPAKARVIEYLQEKAVFVDHGKRQIKAAELPRHPLNKCIASISLLAYIIVSKYCDGLPLYRLEGILKRYGGEITRTSMANWVIRLGMELQPLVNLARAHQLSYDYLQMDETRVKVLKAPNQSASSEKWMWVSRGGPPDRPVVLFDYDSSRGQEVPLRLLEDFRGYLQCDGLGSYDVACKQHGLTQLGCMDHARRKFRDAQKAAKSAHKKGPVKTSKADVAVSKIGALYRFEREIRDLPSYEKYQMRQKVAKPLLNELKVWLEENITNVVKGGLTHKAMYYFLNQWSKLIVYCEDGRLNISNALAENAIRPFAVGRRAWLFCDTVKGAQASAIHYSLIETCRANGVDPQQYYQTVLARLPCAETVEQLEALLPWNLKQTLEKNP